MSIHLRSIFDPFFDSRWICLISFDPHRDSLSFHPMGPRKFGVVKKRSSRNWAPSSQERRTKSRNDESAPCPSTAPSSSLVPPPSIYASRVVTTGRKISFDFLEREGFTIGRALIARGWDYMCSLDLPTYPVLVREFYEKLARGSGGFVSTVRGTEVRLTEQVLARLLKLSREGPAPSIYEDRETALREILQREDVGVLTEVTATIGVKRPTSNVCGRRGALRLENIPSH